MPVSANLLAALAPSEVATGRVFQRRHRQKRVTLNEVYTAIAEHIGFTVNYGPGPCECDIKHSLAKISRATKELGYQPKAQSP